MAWKFSGKADVYIEIAQKLRGYMEIGVYRAGDRLPSVRQAAGEMGVNPNTVARAYTLLEEEGLIVTLPKKGVFVRGEESGEAPPAPAEAEYRAALQAWRARGADYETLLSILKEVYEND